MKAVFSREFFAFFRSMRGWILWASGGFLSGILFVGLTIFGNNADFSRLAATVPLLLIFVVPFLTAPLFAAERQNHTDMLFFAAPIGLFRVVLAKFCAAFLLLCLLFTPVSLWFFVLRPEASGDAWLAYLLAAIVLLSFGAAAVALGIWISATSNHPAGALLFSGAVFLALFVLRWIAWSGFPAFLLWADPLLWMRDAARGLLRPLAVAIPWACTGLFLFLSVQALDARRWRSTEESR